MRGRYVFGRMGGRRMLTFKEIRERSGMNLKQFSDYFEIPYRTIQNWDAGIRHCPDYLLKLMLYKIEKETKKEVEE